MKQCPNCGRYMTWYCKPWHGTILTGWKCVCGYDADSAVIINTNCALSLNRLARGQMKLKLLADIRTDLMVCEIEGWSKMEYLNELKELIDGFFEQTERSE